MKTGIYSSYIKRAMDFCLSLLGIILLSPVLIVLSIMTRMQLGSPLLFRQERIGRGEEVFELYKFRTMSEERDEAGNLLPDSQRSTDFGRKLRSTSLDELPQLFNILRGDMSIVGPRPLLPEYLPYYTEDEKRRHDVRPGLTGLAQISGRNFLKWNDKLAKDIEYVESIGFIGDISIILKTAGKVVHRDGIATDIGETEGKLSEARKNEKHLE